MSRRRSVTAEDALQNSPSRQPPRHSISKYRTEGHHAVCPDPFAVATSHSRRKVTWPENQRLPPPEGEDARLKAIVSDYEECSQKWRSVPVTHQKASETVSRSRGTQNYVRLHNNIEKMQSEVQNFYEEQLRRAIEANPHVIARLRHAQHAGTMPDPNDAALCDEQQAHLDEVITSIYQLRQSSMRFMSMFLNDEEKRHLGGRLHYMFGDDAEDEKIPAHRRYVPQRVLDATLNQREMEAMAAAAVAERAAAAAAERNNNNNRNRDDTSRGSPGESTSQPHTGSLAHSQNNHQRLATAAHPRSHDHNSTSHKHSKRGSPLEAKWDREAAAEEEGKDESPRRKKEKRDKKDKKERKREEAARRAAAAEEEEENEAHCQQQHLVSTPVDQCLQSNGSGGAGGTVSKKSSLKSTASGYNTNGSGMREKDVARIPSSVQQQQQRVGATSPSRSAISTNGGDADVAEFASIDDVPLPWAVSVRHDSSISPSRASSRASSSSPRKHNHPPSPSSRRHSSNNSKLKKGSGGGGSTSSLKNNAKSGGDVNRDITSTNGSSVKSGNTNNRKGSHADPNALSASENGGNAQSEQPMASTTTATTSTTTTTSSKATSKRGRLPGTLQQDNLLQDAATGDSSANVADASTETPRRHEHDQQDLYEEVHSGQLCLSPISKQQKEKEDAAVDAEKMRAMIHEELERDRLAREEAEKERIQFVADEAAVLAQVAAEEAEGRIREESAKRAALEEQLRQVEAERDAAKERSMAGNHHKGGHGGLEGSMSSIHSDDSDFTKEMKKRNQRRRRGLDLKGKKGSQTRSSTSPDPLNATTALSIECVDGVERIDVGPKPPRLSRLKLQEGEFHRHGFKPTYKLGMAPADETHHHKRQYHHSASAQPSPRRALTPRQHTVLGIDLPLQFTTRARSIPPPKFISPVVSPKKGKSEEDKGKTSTTTDKKQKKKSTTNTKQHTSGVVDQRTSSGTRRRVRADSATKKKRVDRVGGGSAGAPV